MVKNFTGFNLTWNLLSFVVKFDSLYRITNKEDLRLFKHENPKLKVFCRVCIVFEWPIYRFGKKNITVYRIAGNHEYKETDSLNSKQSSINSTRTNQGEMHLNALFYGKKRNLNLKRKKFKGIMNIRNRQFKFQTVVYKLTPD